MKNLLVSGFVKTSMIDYPGHICSIIFLGRCNFRCGYCHNPDLVTRPDKIPRFDIDSIFNFLEKKKNWITAVCVTGGEPTLQKQLPEFLKRLKDINLKIKLDTNGTNPEMLKKMIKQKLVDYIAMDIKASKDNYQKATKVKVNIKNIEESIDLIKSSDLDYEFRTTITPDLIDEKEIEKITRWLKKDTKTYCLQQFVPVKVLDEKYLDIDPYLKPDLEKMKKIAEKTISKVELRNC